MIPANEMNLTVEGGDENWLAHIKWLETFSFEWQKRSPVILHLPALSPSGHYDLGWQAYGYADLYALFDVVDYHCYTIMQVLDAHKHSVTTHKLASITEFNRIDPHTLFSSPAPFNEAVYFLLGGTPDQKEYDIMQFPTVFNSFKEPTTVVDFSSPNHEGPRTQTLGIVIHATLGGTSSPDSEYNATVNWFNDPSSQVSAHALVGPGGKIWYPVRPDLIAWHCRASNATHLGIEMAKSLVPDVIDPTILEVAAKTVARWCVFYNIPPVWSTVHGIEEHRNMPTNTDGHQDVGGPFDRVDFLNRVLANMGGVTMTPEQKAQILDHLDFLWAYSSAVQTSKNPAESEKIMHERIVALKILLGLQ
jgi:hypothetical protein